MTAPVAAGTAVAGFRVESLIGEGAMGAVYLAQEAATGRRVALKLLAPALGQDERFRQRFLREAEIAASLEHPHIVRTLAFGEDEGLLYLAMDYVEGSDLRELLRREGRLEPEHTIELLLQVAEALDAAHWAGLVHRDVKPGNILLRSGPAGGEAYVCDFGLARHVSSVSSLTGDRGFVGTIDYVSPEQIEGSPVDGRTDLYSLGCVLYECLAGERPFERDSELSVVFAHLNEPPPRLSEVRPDLPEEFDAVFETALAKSPGERYSTCGELAAAAQAALQGKVFVRRSRRGRRLLLVAIATIALAAGITVAGLELTTHAPPAKVVAVQPNSVAAIDPETNRVVEGIPVGHLPRGVAVGAGAAWVLNGDDRTVSRIDLDTKSVRTVAVRGVPTDLTAAFGALWIVDGLAGKLYKHNSETGFLERTIKLPLPDPDLEPFRQAAYIASGRGAIWISGLTGGKSAQTKGPIPKPFLWRLDPRRVRIVSTRQGRTIEGGADIAVGEGGIWAVASYGAGVVRIDPRSNLATKVETPSVGDVLSKKIATGVGAVWEADRDGTLLKIDPTVQRVVRAVTIGQSAVGVAVGFGSVWVADLAAGKVVRVDPSTATVLQRISVAGTPSDVAIGDKLVWVTVA